ncbi:hypothetical protein [Streptomyces sp. HYC2]|uniref:hypothetical protein n=1 Tax=Streptomyces sp. HYC2 TaxID=2955207 RepID=UPI002480321D|nr:hypothetical protein [Streptomyces sp. HYC2]
MTGGELTLGAVLARLEEREREIAAQAETTREQITHLTAQLDELGRAADEVRITGKTLLALPDPQPPAPPALKLPDHPAYQQIMAVFAVADHPLRARQVCESMDLETSASNSSGWPTAESWPKPSQDYSPGHGRNRLEFSPDQHAYSRSMVESADASVGVFDPWP